MLQIDRLRDKWGMDPNVKINVLVVDDEEEFCKQVIEELEQTSSYHCRSARTIAEAVQELESRPFDVLSADWRFGDADCGWLMIPPARRSNPWIGILVYSMYSELEGAAIAAGANSFLLKNFWVNGEYTRTLSRVVLSSLRRRLIDFSTGSVSGQQAFLAATSPSQGWEVACRPDRVKEVIDVISKIQLLDENLDFVELLRFNNISELMTEPTAAFVLSFIRDFGPLSHSDLHRDIQLPGNRMGTYIQPVLAAGLIESVGGKLRVTVEGDFYLSMFGLVEKASKQ